ncbi:hypothetical protein [Paenibacillus sedimenti]|uniref:DUF4025 domain-containing protein n=1 Tax=Paenibacillus sedimenti TaxID=2770274 RepID=A0A926KJP2_9BACL|nr:hypothetical protein [Paenibacillus sedimenti]MBD0378855.1 hypothetical protein [Paenibacillus sedimenti]
MDQNKLQKQLDRPVSWAQTTNPSEAALSDQVEHTDEEIPSNYQAMGESYSDTTNFEVNKSPGRLN